MHLAQTGKWFQFGLFVLLAWAFSPGSIANTTAVSPHTTLNFSTKELNLSPCFRYTEAKSNEAKPIDLKQRDHIAWQAIDSTHVNLGFQSSPFWLHCTLKTADIEADSWILEQSYALIDDMKLFVFSQGELLYQWHVGDTQAFANRPLKHTSFLFPLKLQPQQTYDFYIWVENTEAMELPLRLFEYNEFTAEDTQRSVTDGIFYGLLLIMAAYNLVLFLNIRDRSYFYYVSYVICMLLFFMSQKGFLFQYFFPRNPELHHYSIPFILVITLHSVAMFFKDFLQLPSTTPKAWVLIKLILALNVLFAVFIFVLPYQLSIFLIIGNAASAALLGLGIAIYLSGKGKRTAQMVLAGWSLLIICIVFMTLSKIGIIYNEFMANYGLRLGTSFEILIFSFALSYRINEERQAKEMAMEQVSQERHERIRAQELALQKEIEVREAKEDALIQQKALNENLEQLVQERTAKLEHTLKDLEKANKELEMLSAKDGLTGVFNRRTFDQRGQDEWRRSRRQQEPLALLMIDIDHFKAINDSKGHQCGDYVLQTLAELMTHIVSRPADLVTRYGGEEFAVLLPNTPANGAQHIAAELVSKTQAMPLEWDGTPFNITISIGVSCTVASDNSDIESLIGQADEALYKAKRNGRNQWLFADAAD